MNDRNIIILFMKAPVEGQVKTRIASERGRDFSLGLYRNLVLDCLDLMIKTGCPFRVCFYPETARAAVTGLVGGEYDIAPQQGNDLGARMKNAFHSVFREGCNRAVLIGSDIPDITPDLIREAFLCLDRHDVVIGPAADGGYYLVGFSRETFEPRVFDGIAWSTATVLQDTINILSGLSMTIHRTRELSDIDTVKDLRLFLERNEKKTSAASRTLAFVRMHDNQIRGNRPPNGLDE